MEFGQPVAEEPAIEPVFYQLFVSALHVPSDAGKCG